MAVHIWSYMIPNWFSRGHVLLDVTSPTLDLNSHWCHVCSSGKKIMFSTSLPVQMCTLCVRVCVFVCVFVHFLNTNRKRERERERLVVWPQVSGCMERSPHTPEGFDLFWFWKHVTAQSLCVCMRVNSFPVISCAFWVLLFFASSARAQVKTSHPPGKHFVQTWISPPFSEPWTGAVYVTRCQRHRRKPLGRVSSARHWNTAQAWVHVPICRPQFHFDATAAGASQPVAGVACHCGQMQLGQQQQKSIL